jgi:hypothetical protein
VISNHSDGANFMPRIEKLMYKQQVPACVGMTVTERESDEHCSVA